MMKRILMLLTIVLLLGCLTMTAFATSQPNLTENGSITVTMDWNGTKLNDGKLSICRVAEIKWDGEQYSFIPVDALKAEALSLANPMDAQLAQKMELLVKEKKLTVITAPIQDGEAVFSDLQPGLYLVMQEKEDAAKGFAPIAPYLISVPKRENGWYYSNVEADPKVPLETAPTEPEPTKPNDSKLPQTGQLNWPVPLMTMGGLTLFVFGWYLCFGGRRERYEK